MKNKILKIINKILILLYGFLKRILRKETKESKNILVLLHDPGFGDTLCSLDALKKMGELYPKNLGYNIFIATSAKTSNFLTNIKCTYGYNFIVLDIDENERDNFPIFKANFKKLDRYVWKDIIAFNRIGPYIKLLLIGLKIKKAYYIETKEKLNKKISLDYILNLLITGAKVIPIKAHCMMFDMYTILLNTINPDLKIKVGIGFIPRLETKRIEDEKYCVVSCGIAAGHMYPFRGWKMEQFAEVIDYISENLGLKVYLCGGQEDVKANNDVYNLVNNKENVCDVTGKTNFKEWVELTRGAEFVLGNDSGYIHLAAAVNTQAFVIIGFWNYGRFHPYQVDQSKNIGRAPILISAEEPKCIRCNMFEFWGAEKNEAKKAKKLCDQCIKNKGIYKCILDISTTQAIATIEKSIKSDKCHK